MAGIEVQRSVRRLSTSVLLALALLCLLAPFVTVGCDQKTTYSGTTFIRGNPRAVHAADQSSEAGPERVLSAGAAPITLALVFGSLGIIVALLPGLAATSAAYAAALATAGAFLAFLLSGSLRGVESVFLDFRYGFWGALALASAAAVAAWTRWALFPRVVEGAALLIGFGGAALLTLGALVAPAILGNASGNPDVFRGLPVAGALAPGFRSGQAWDAAALVAIPFLGVVVLLILARQASRLAAWTLVGLGVGWALAALQTLAYFAASRHYGVGDGAYLGLLGSLALAGAGLMMARSSGAETLPLEVRARALVLVGATAAVVGTLVTFERIGGRSVALLYGGQSATRWLALQPIAVAVLAVVASWVLPRARSAAALIGLAAALLFSYVELLTPLTEKGEDPATHAGAGAIIGAAGALVILVAALLALRRAPATARG